MVTQKQLNNRQIAKSLWYTEWLPPVEVIGPEQMPRLKRVSFDSLPLEICGFRRKNLVSDPAKSIVHGFNFDFELRGICGNPELYLNDFAKFGAVIAPDPSMYREMPRHERVRAAWMSRAIAAYFEFHGLLVLPNIRWGKISDLNFALDGLPKQSTIAISTQSLTRDKESNLILVEGFKRLVEELEPDGVLIYGSMPQTMHAALPEGTKIRIHPTDIARVHVKRGA